MRWHIIAAITRSLHINHAGFSVVLLRACWMQGAEKCMEDGHATVCTCNEDLCNRAGPASTLDFSKRTSSLFILLMSSLVTLFINSWWLISHLPSAFVITAKCDNKTSASPSNFVKQQPKYNEIPEVFSMYRRRYWRRKRQFVWLVAFSRFIKGRNPYWSFQSKKAKKKKLLNVHISLLSYSAVSHLKSPPFKKCKMVKKKGVCAAEKWMRLLTPTALKCLQAVVPPPPLWWSRNLCRNIYSPHQDSWQEWP